MNQSKRNGKNPSGAILQSLPEAEGASNAWEEIESGRYMPRRIRGSLRGRELG
jgi:hypothetical protein